MKIPQSTFDFIQNKTCPYCQSKLKAGADFTVCPNCGTPHHKECWEENSGCTTYGCVNNPHTEQKVDIESQNVGSETVETIRDSLKQPTQQNLIQCANCKSEIEAGSTYCKFCGYNVVENKFDLAKKEFENEYKKRYETKIGITRRRFLVTAGSFVILFATVAFLFYLTVTKLNQYFSSDEYKIKNTVSNWKDAWEEKDIERFKSYMTEDYVYFGKDGKSINFKDRIRRIESTFKNYKDIKIKFSDFKIINDSTTTESDKKVQMYEEYQSDKYHEKGKKIMRLYKGSDTNNEWKIYREFFE